MSNKRVFSTEKGLVTAVYLSHLKRGVQAWSTTGTHSSHCHLPSIALVMHEAALCWADTALAHLGATVCAHLSCLFCLLAALMDGNQSFLCHLTPFTLIWKGNCSYSLCKSALLLFPQQIPSTHWLATGDFNIVLLSSLDLKMNKSLACPIAKSINQICKDRMLTEMWQNLHLFSKIAFSPFLNATFTILIWEPILVLLLKSKLTLGMAIKSMLTSFLQLFWSSL